MVEVQTETQYLTLEREGVVVFWVGNQNENGTRPFSLEEDELHFSVIGFEEDEPPLFCCLEIVHFFFRRNHRLVLPSVFESPLVKALFWAGKEGCGRGGPLSFEGLLRLLKEWAIRPYWDLWGVLLLWEEGAFRPLRRMVFLPYECRWGLALGLMEGALEEVGEAWVVPLLSGEVYDRLALFCLQVLVDVDRLLCGHLLDQAVWGLWDGLLFGAVGAFRLLGRMAIRPYGGRWGLGLGLRVGALEEVGEAWVVPLLWGEVYDRLALLVLVDVDRLLCGHLLDEVVWGLWDGLLFGAVGAFRQLRRMVFLPYECR